MNQMMIFRKAVIFMATTPTQIRIDSDIKQRGFRIIQQPGSGYVQCSEFIPSSVCPPRRHSVFHRASLLQPTDFSCHG